VQSPAVENPEVFVVVFLVVVAAVVAFAVVRSRRRGSNPPAGNEGWYGDDQGPGPEGHEP
jgi:hypothetical protein